MQSGPPLYLSTESIYGKFECAGEHVLVLRELKASREYVLYSVAEDRENKLSEIEQLNITSKDRYVTAEASVVFYTKALNEAQRKKIMEQMAFVLSLPTWKVLEKEDYEEDWGEEARLLQGEEESVAEEEQEEEE